MTWEPADGECRPRRRRRGRARPLTDLHTKPGSAGIFFDNNEHSHVYIYNRSTGETMELPEDGMVFIVMDQKAAYEMRDNLLDPTEFPEDIHS